MRRTGMQVVFEIVTTQIGSPVQSRVAIVSVRRQTYNHSRKWVPASGRRQTTADHVITLGELHKMGITWHGDTAWLLKEGDGCGLSCF